MKSTKNHAPRGGWRLGPPPATTVEFIRSAERLRDIVAYLDRELGEGYAATHPSLIAALAQTDAIDAGADYLGYALDELRDTLRSALQQPCHDVAAPAWDRLAMLRVLARLVRQDCHKVGRFLSRSGTYSAWEFVRVPLTDDRLRQHLADTRVVSAYPMGGAGSNTTLVGVFDIDNKQGAPWDRLTAVALRIIAASRAAGLYPCPIRSGSGTGAHLWCRWDRPQRADDVRAQMRKVLQQAGCSFTSSSNTAPDDDGICVQIFPFEDATPIGGFTPPITLPFAGNSVPLDMAMEPIDEPLPWASSTPLPQPSTQAGEPR
jgi:hypothetical protein